LSCTIGSEAKVSCVGWKIRLSNICRVNDIVSDIPVTGLSAEEGNSLMVFDTVVVVLVGIGKNIFLSYCTSTNRSRPEGRRERLTVVGRERKDSA